MKLFRHTIQIIVLKIIFHVNNISTYWQKLKAENRIWPNSDWFGLELNHEKTQKLQFSSTNTMIDFRKTQNISIKIKEGYPRSLKTVLSSQLLNSTVLKLRFITRKLIRFMDRSLCIASAIVQNSFRLDWPRWYF